MTASFTKKDVLQFMDNCVIYNPGFFFMDLDHGYFHTANSRLSLYAEEARWAIIFEKSGYANRAGRVELALNYFGNCLSNLTHGGLYYHFNYNSKHITLVDGDALQEIEADFEEIAPSATHVRLRDQTLAIPSHPEGWAKWIPPSDDDDVHWSPTFVDLARYIAFEYCDLCRATDSEKRQCIPADLPLLGTIDEWHQRSYGFYENGPVKEVFGEAPSTYETFPLIADVLCARDLSLFRPTLPPNNHWSNWPDAGSL